jgi:F-type H+-transporting ATPase subunit beta
MELIHAMVAGYDGISVFAGVGERSREGHEMLLDMRGSGVLDRTVLVYGQMNEPPAPLARADERADHCRMVPRRSAPQCPAADGQRVPLRSGGRGSLGLLGRLPSRVGYQPTLASEVAALEERIASVGGASVTAIQAVYVPADDFTDPAVTTIAAHADLDGGSLARHGRRRIYPPSTRSPPRPSCSIRWWWARNTRRPPSKCGAIEHYRELEDVIALLGMEELGAEDRRIVGRARRLQRFLTQPFTVTEGLTGTPGRSVKLADTIAGCRAILDGECDDWAEASLYMIGTLDEGRAKEAAAKKAAA